MPRPLNVEARERIVTAARDLFLERGYKSVSMEEVANAVGMRKANLFHYYPSKEMLGQAVLDRTGAELRADVDRELTDFEGDPIDRVVEWFTRFRVLTSDGEARTSSSVGNIMVEMATSHPNLQATIASNIAYWIEHLDAYLEHWKTTGYFRQDMDSHCTAETIVALVHGTLIQWRATLSQTVFESCAKCLREFLTLKRSQP